MKDRDKLGVELIAYYCYVSFFFQNSFKLDCGRVLISHAVIYYAVYITALAMTRQKPR